MNTTLPSAPFLCLGTVQTGMAYGLAGAGLPDEQKVAALFDAAVAAGIRSFDTAQAYGLAEARLGAWLQARGLASCEVITKFPKLGGLNDDAAAAAIRASCAQSRRLLGRSQLDGLMAHDGRDMARAVVVDTLCQLRDAGQIRAFGASVYDPQDAETALRIHALELLQVPLSLLDRRFAESGLLHRAAAGGVRVYARSLFTQGLLFLDPANLPPHLATAAPVLRELREAAAAHETHLSALALGYVARTPGVAALVIGCDTTDQLREAAETLRSGLPGDPVLTTAIEAARRLPEGTADPRTWRK